VDGYLVRSLTSVLSPPSAPPSEGGFEWSAVAARRSLGLSALGSCLSDRTRTPADAVEEALRSAERLGVTGRTGSLGRWLVTLGPGARAATEAEAVRWTTAVLGALDWERIGTSAEIGGPDWWWECPSAPRVCLRGRAELRTRIEAGDGSSHGLVLFSVLAGWPGPTARVELAVCALAHTLATKGPAGVPRRVAGWWPQAGRSLALDVDASLLDQAVDATIQAVRAAWGLQRHAHPDSTVPARNGR
jgi:hypothetical protein